MKKVFFVYVIPPKMEGDEWRLQNVMQRPVYWPDPKTNKPKEFSSKEEILQAFKTDKNLDGIYADVKSIEDLKQRGVHIEEIWKKKTSDVLGFEI